jgi:hypothetical protein
MANKSSTAAANAKALAKVLRQRNNEDSAKFLAIGMAGIMVVFLILN